MSDRDSDTPRRSGCRSAGAGRAGRAASGPSPIFTKQLSSARTRPERSGIALVSAVYERGLRHAELPDPLPEPPPIPYEHLLRLGAAIRGTAKLLARGARHR